ncbi:MAG: ADP-ribosyl-(dinitrogen reductase) hydrolase [Persicimonas sp.]
MNILIITEVQKKLRRRHGVRLAEVEECFVNATHGTIVDTRERHRTVPPTEWFIAETDAGRRLKVVFIEDEFGDLIIKTAYEPDANEEALYDELK